VSRQRIILVTAGIMLSLFLASMESTVVATAMPTIVGQLGGLEHYAWVFSAYMLASTTTVPLYGKLSDMYGRRRLYAAAMIFFLAGSVLCGRSESMNQLIFARALQGVGAGGIMPLAFILIGEIFSLEQRAKMQGLFSGVWGVSSIVGPLLGGYLVDQFSWHWVFYVNVLPGLLAAGFVIQGYRESPRDREHPAVDYAGAAWLTASILLLLFGLLDFGTPYSWSLILFALISFFVLVWVERRAPDPILPTGLFRERLFSTAIAHGLLAGCAMFGSISFVPLYVQSVLGTNATQAGLTITPLLLGWVSASVIGMRLILSMGYRRLSVAGMILLAAGAFLMTLIDAESSRGLLMTYITMMGIGMGLSIPSFLVAVQTSVERRQLGTATSTLQFSRSIGGTLGVSLMGAALSARLASNLSASGLDPGLVERLLDRQPGVEVIIDSGLRLALADAIHLVFVIAFAAAVLGLLAVLFAPRTQLRDKAADHEPSAIEAG
jgi:EmrB/QacA subfamily drug resistance transporter